MAARITRQRRAKTTRILGCSAVGLARWDMLAHVAIDSGQSIYFVDFDESRDVRLQRGVPKVITPASIFVERLAFHRTDFLVGFPRPRALHTAENEILEDSQSTELR